MSNDNIEQMRGIDPHIFNERGNYMTLLVKGSGADVARALSKHSSIVPEIADALTGPVIFKSEPELAIYVYQLRGHDWTQIDGRDVYLLGLAEHLSRELGTRVFSYMFQDVTGGRMYSICDRGELIESFSDIDLSGFGDDAVEDSRQHLTKNGYRVSSSGHISFLSKRGTWLDVESPGECDQIMEKVAKELGFYVAADVLFVNDSNHIECWQSWSFSDLQCARVVRALSEDEEYQRRSESVPADEEEKLEIKPDPEAFERMQRMARGAWT